MSHKKRKKIKDIHDDNNIEKENIEKYGYPKFCFKYLQEVSFNKSNDFYFFIDFLLRLKKLSELGWNEINKSDRHSYGYELISINQIRQNKLPEIITKDMKTLTVFRANGQNKPFIGIRNGDIFHIIFIETNFGDVYNHH
ncbi:MAG: hypothetical protein LBE91_02040 [Tannerella sp.]|jgi:hypothetical protein|nr:hypothetical protein [Tannerella sp.]